MKIRVDRESVCIGDDVFSHQMDLDIPENMTVEFSSKGQISAWIGYGMASSTWWKDNNKL